MAKQTIEIDVPDGCEVDYLIPLWSYRETQDVRLFFKKKESEYLEVREFIARKQSGKIYVDSITRWYHCTPEKAEKLPGFVKWVDSDWRKVEI